MKKFILILLPLCVPVLFLTARAQTQVSGWATVVTLISIDNKNSFQYDMSERSTDQLEHLQTLLIRPGFSHRFTEHWRLSVGYHWALNRKGVGDHYSHFAEQAIWEQLWYNRSFSLRQSPGSSKLALTARAMLDQRFIPALSLTNNYLNKDGTDLATRLRLLARTLFPLGRKPEFTKGQYLALQDELFINLSGRKYTNGNGFDQNRTALSTGYRFSKKFDLELGYVFRYAMGSNRAYVRDHVIQLLSFIRL